MTIGGGGGIGFGKFSYVKVEPAIPHSKGLFTHTIWSKGFSIQLFNYYSYVQATPKCKNHGALKIIALHPYSSSEDCNSFLYIPTKHEGQENIGYGQVPIHFVLRKK